MSVMYQDIIAILVATAQEQQGEIDDLRVEVGVLRNETEKLRGYMKSREHEMAVMQEQLRADAEELARNQQSLADLRSQLDQVTIFLQSLQQTNTTNPAFQQGIIFP